MVAADPKRAVAKPILPVVIDTPVVIAGVVLLLGVAPTHCITVISSYLKV
jgi:hypothetical protein